MNIYITKVNPSEFEGYTYMSELTDEQLYKLGLVRDERLDSEIEVCGEFRSRIEYNELNISHIKVTISRGMDYVNLVPDIDFSENDLYYKITNRLDYDEVYNAQLDLLHDQILDAYKETYKH